ncbi:MAG: prepilin-type N-terminal cleavage/methylation domain-containing protein [Bacilli bacterium]|nr:prepilin-type N-terminal cleavage/methylation domain-containing protein [Bacilli bacterium]
MKKLNKKGFTLIELLAVIIILGVLLLIAVPSVSKYIQQSRMKTYRNNLSGLISAVTNEVNSMDSADYTFRTEEVLVVPFSKIELEKGSNEKSPFNTYVSDKSFVLVVRKYDGDGNAIGYEYYIQALDNSGYGTMLKKDTETEIKALKGTDLITIPADEAAVTDTTFGFDLPDGLKVKLIG